MKTIITVTFLALAASTAAAAPPPGYCEVTVCTKPERMTLDLRKLVQDAAREVCRPAVLGQEDARPAKVLNGYSRWYQNSPYYLNSSTITRVKTVQNCTAAAPKK